MTFKNVMWHLPILPLYYICRLRPVFSRSTHCSGINPISFLIAYSWDVSFFLVPSNLIHFVARTSQKTNADLWHLICLFLTNKKTLKEISLDIFPNCHFWREKAYTLSFWSSREDYWILAEDLVEDLAEESFVLWTIKQLMTIVVQRLKRSRR